CLISGAILDVMEPALWVLAVMANVTAVQRIVFPRRMMRAEPRRARVLLPVVVAALLLMPAASDADPETERAWTSAVAAFQQGDAVPVAQAFASEAALSGPIGDHARWLLADALARVGDLAGARAAALGIADRYPDSRLAPRALVEAAVLASRAGDEEAAQAALRRLLDRYPDAAELPEAFYLLGQTAEARAQRDVAVLAYRQPRVRSRPPPGARRPISSPACVWIRRAC